jgi:PAS domain S-box-containing protein
VIGLEGGPTLRILRALQVTGNQTPLEHGPGLNLAELGLIAIETTADAILLLDQQARILFANSATSRLFRYAPAELIGLSLTTLIPEASGECGVAELVGVGKGGGELPLELTVQAHVVNERSIFTVCIRDIRDRKQAEMMRTLLANRAMLRTDIGVALTAGRTARGMLQRCAEALVRHLNAAFARIWTLDEERGVLELQASAGQYTHIDGRHGRVPLGQFKIGLIAQERRAVATNDVISDPHIHDKDWAAREGMVAFAGHPLIVDNHVVGVMALFSRHPLTDFTLDDLAAIADAIAQGLERLRAEAAIQAKQAELMRVARIVTVGELLGSIAHEVNQPLAAMVANARACKNMLRAPGPPLAEIQKTVDDIATDGLRAHDIIGRIHGLLERGRPEADHIDINRVVQEVLELTRNECLKKRITLQTDLAISLPSVLGDRVQLQQVVLNLITNAVEAMSHVEEERRRLTIATTCDGNGHITVHVRDTGIGIDPQHMERIFEPFFTTKAQGMGIGLSISRTIVTEWGGRLWATPNAQDGTTVSFTLPVSSPVQER